MHFPTGLLNQNVNILKTAAIEVGFGDTKWAYRDANLVIQRKSFPSLAPLHEKSATENSIGLQKKDTHIVLVNNALHEVGPDVHLVTSQTNSGKWLSDDFPQSDNYMALVFGSISMMGADRIEQLILGLPLHTMDQYTEMVKKKFTGTFKFGDREVTILKVSVIAQPIGTLVRCASENLNVNNDVNTLIIDPGYYSTDWVVANGYRIIKSRSDGRVAGVSPILNAVCKLISIEIGSHFDQVARINNAIKNKASVNILGSEFTYDKIWNYVVQCESIVNDCINEIFNSVGNIKDLDSIILTGGGSVYYEALCKKRFAPIPIHTLHNPAFANVVGYLLAGEGLK